MSELAKLCKGLSAALVVEGNELSDESSAADAVEKKQIFLTTGLVCLSVARALARTAESLEADELARLDMVGAQPRELQEPKADV